jgi:ubiquinone/menaquinone biosynthesis C-methylase UbiE
VATREELKEQQLRQWKGNAASWDGQHERLEREMAAVSQWLCREARLRPGMKGLDLACGSGHPAIDVARQVGPDGNVVATDFASEMVEVTRRRVAEAGLTNVETRVMDLENIEYPDDSFDAATCRFGVMFCPQPARALSEVRRVLKPGGRFALSVWDEPERSPAQTVLGEALRRFGRPARVVDFDAPGVYQLAPPGKLQSLLEAAGFSDVRVESMPLTMEYESADAFWQRRLAGPGQRVQLQELSSEEVQRLKAIFFEVIQPYVDGDRIRLTQTPLLAVGEK